ncbi:MAG: TIGR04076 family protein [Clostridia bacterium]|nr:TIGR04076 family protein [Clostridia bacterium]
MEKCRITVVKMAQYDDLIEKYENPIEHTCDLKMGDTFISVYGKKPEGFCDSAWESMEKFVSELAKGGGNFFDGWMKNEKSAMISCNDGFRPVSFYIEVIENE